MVHIKQSPQGVPSIAGLWSHPQVYSTAQKSSVQTLLSSQFTPTSSGQVPLLQVAAAWNTSPLQLAALHCSVLLAWPQPLPASQKSSVQTLPSLQLSPATLGQIPLLQVAAG